MEPRHRRSKARLQRNTALASHRDRSSFGGYFFKLLGLILLLFVTGASAWGAKAYFDVRSTANSTFTGKGGKSTLITQNKPISILLLGADTGVEGREDRGNSDTMILVTLNPKDKSSTMVSIPRDLLTEIKGVKRFNMARVNSAYNANGAEAAKKTVSELLNVPVNFYVMVDMQALENLVNAVGGIDVDVPFDFSYGWSDFKEGKVHLNGRGALDFARMRKDDPKGDYGRQARQRQVISAIVQRGLSFNGVSNYQKVLKVVAQYMKTDLSFDDMMSIALNYRSTAGDLKSDYIKGHDVWIGEAAMQVAKTSELQRVSNLLRRSLGLESETLDNENTRQNSLQSDLDWKNPNPFSNYVIYDEFSDTEPWEGLQ